MEGAKLGESDFMKYLMTHVWPPGHLNGVLGSQIQSGSVLTKCGHLVSAPVLAAVANWGAESTGRPSSPPPSLFLSNKLAFFKVKFPLPLPAYQTYVLCTQSY